jgi:hypothetical protein
MHLGAVQPHGEKWTDSHLNTSGAEQDHLNGRRAEHLGSTCARWRPPWRCACSSRCSGTRRCFDISELKQQHMLLSLKSNVHTRIHLHGRRWPQRRSPWATVVAWRGLEDGWACAGDGGANCPEHLDDDSAKTQRWAGLHG